MNIYCELKAKGKILNEFYNKEANEYSFKNFIKNSKIPMYSARRGNKEILSFETCILPKDIFQELCRRYPNEKIVLDFITEGRERRKLVYENLKIIYKDEETIEKEMFDAIKKIDINNMKSFNCSIVSYNEKHNYEEESE